MRNKGVLTILFLLLPCFAYATKGHYKVCSYAVGDEISLAVYGQTGKNGSNFTYIYAVRSNPQSVQNLWSIDIILPEKKIIVNATAPATWDVSWSGKPLIIPPEFWELSGMKPFPQDYEPQVDPPYRIGWFPDKKEGGLKPLETISGLLFETSYGLPGIVDYYAEGYASGVTCTQELEEGDERIPGYDDLTPYGPGIVGRTLGPTAPPEILKPVEFIANLIKMKEEAYTLGWITDKGSPCQ